LRSKVHLGFCALIIIIYSLPNRHTDEKRRQAD
jgi:hypothetical protein